MCLHSSVVITIILNDMQSYIYVIYYYLYLFQQLASEQIIFLNLMKCAQIKERAGQLTVVWNIDRCSHPTTLT